MIGWMGIAVVLVCFAMCDYFIKITFYYNTEIPQAENIYKLSFNESISSEEVLRLFPEVTDIVPEQKKISFQGIFSEDVVSLPYSVSAMEVAPEFIDFYPFLLTEGSMDKSKSSANTVLLFESFIKRRNLEAETIVGKVIESNDRSYHITGLIKDFPKANMFEAFDGIVITNRLEDTNTYYVKLVNNDSKTLEEKIKKRNHQEESSNKANIEPILKQLEDISIDKIVPFFILSLGSLVLICAFFNYISFHFACFLDRLKESAIRKVNGAGKIQIYCLFLSEFVAGIVFAGILSYILAYIFIPFFNSLGLTREFDFSELKNLLICYI
ncbi:MAG: ABC transporter permease, partial [Bacteroidales bacterium]|nr:ABC transporter permease [Bacteroidales bacterium]